MEKSKLVEWFGEEWFMVLEDYLLGDEFNKLGLTIAAARQSFSVLPPKEENHLIFKAFKELQPSDIKAVLLGYEPSIKKGVYDGYSFSESRILYPTEQLATILTSIQKQFPENVGRLDYGKIDELDLERWVKQGVFLPNSALTSLEGVTGQHINLWDSFTRTWMTKLSMYRKDIAWMLFKMQYLKYHENISNSFIVNSDHPLYVSKHKSFDGKIFKDTNEYLLTINKSKIIW